MWYTLYKLVPNQGVQQVPFTHETYLRDTLTSTLGSSGPSRYFTLEIDLERDPHRVTRPVN